MQLAPDGQIYVTQYLDEKQLHRIAQPDRKGKECEFIKFGLELPTRHSANLPYFPNYNLGPLPPQDSLDCASGRFILQPNPVNQDLTILSLPCHETDWSIFNSLGQWQMDVSVTDVDKDTHLDVSRWQSGIYLLSGRSSSGKKLTYRFVVAH
ncbi:MAG: T9SS type A sorting domain-containing protein [Saprospiraceae bacterium]|nr:T9SS type A sorting domain-containing protein [Saprospiraceae bacterium]